MDHDIPPPEQAAPGRRARRLLRRSARRIPGTLALAGVAFALVTVAAGTGTHDLGAAQPIQYHEECWGEGCSSEEVHELWWTLREECLGEGCWMEEVGENAGTGVYRDQWGFWQYQSRPLVDDMLRHMNALGHPAYTIRPMPGYGPGIRGVRASRDAGDEVTVTCEEGAGGGYDCKP
jgi:hypothetical protein